MPSPRAKAGRHRERWRRRHRRRGGRTGWWARIGSFCRNERRGCHCRVSHGNDSPGSKAWFKPPSRQASKLLRIASSFSLRPMKTRRLSRFSSLAPGALVRALDDHVHALEHIAVRVAVHGENALQAQDVRALDLRHLLDPGEELAADRARRRAARSQKTELSWRG